MSLNIMIKLGVFLLKTKLRTFLTTVYMTPEGFLLKYWGRCQKYVFNL